MIEDYRAVLAPVFIRTLVIERCRVVELPEHVEEFLVGDLLGVIGNLYHFNMPRVPLTDGFIRRRRGRTPHITDAGCPDTRHRTEEMFCTPKASCAKGCVLHMDPFGPRCSC